jgi:hypothetical protein
MRSILRPVLVGGLAILAFSALATASASAEAVKCPGTNEKGAYVLCSGGVTQVGTFTFTGVHEATTPITFFVPSYEWEMGCEEGKITKGSFDGTASKLEIAGLYMEITRCNEPAEGNTVCEVLPIVIDGDEGTGTGPGLSATIASSSELELVSTSSGELWSKVKIRSKGEHMCTMAGLTPSPLHGKQECKLLEGATEKVTHVLKCESIGSHLKLFGKETLFTYAAELSLTSGKNWSIQKL